MEPSIEDAVRPIRDNWLVIKNAFFQSNPGQYLILTFVHRPPELQLELFKKGREQDAQGNWVVVDKSQVVTNCDGYKVLSAHNYFPSRAIDIAVVDNKSGAIIWEESYYQCLLEIATGVGLVSGAGWKSLKDSDHIEIKDYKNYAGD